MPYCTIVIPVYNAADYLRGCLDSVLAQTITDWEAICVDDGSTDGSGAILDEYAAVDDRFRVVHQNNKGASVARNVGIELARGEWISFIDADDWVSTDYLSSFERMKEKADINFTPIRFVWSDSEYSDYSIYVPNVIVGSLEMAHFFEHLAFGRSGRNLFGYSVNKFLRRELIVRHHVRFPDGVFPSEDEIFMLRFCEHAKSVATLREVCYNYRNPEMGLTTKRRNDWHVLFDAYRDFGRISLSSGLRKIALAHAMLILVNETSCGCCIADAKLVFEFYKRHREVLRGTVGVPQYFDKVCGLPVCIAGFVLFARARLRSFFSRG